MQIRNYKNTEEKISLLGLGCMRFPTKKENDRDVIDEQKAQEIVDYAYAHGVNYYDTAYMYHDGQSEKFMGKALSKYKRSTYNLVTKLPIWMADTPKDMERIFNEQLSNLRTDYFDFYLLHALDAEKFKKCEQFKAYEFLCEMKKQGKIRHLGFSFHDSPDVLQNIVNAHEWDFAQIQLNYLDWELQNAKRQYEILSENGIPCVVMEPVRGGTLASPCEKSCEIFKSAAPDKSVASWAIRYVANLPNVLTILSGMTTIEQIVDNVSTVSSFVPLTEQDKRVIADALDAYKKKDTIPCTGCRYCMDCPSGVDIPNVFKIYNKYAVEKNKQEFIDSFDKIYKSSGPDLCISCGQCAEHCPQSIKIPDKLKEIAGIYNSLKSE